MKIYGLTGGTGCGKSTVARRLATHGITVIDADAVGHDVIAPGGSGEDLVREAFGDAILSCGTISREKLGSLVFHDAAARTKLNAIVHPLIRIEIASRCAGLAASGQSCAVVDAALLAEDGKKPEWLNGLILVLADENVRRERLVRNRGIDQEEAMRRIASQLPPEDKRPLADWILENNGTLEALNSDTDRLAEELLNHG